MNIIRRDSPWTLPFNTWPALIDEELFSDANREMTVYETDGELVVKANVAGVPSENVDISIEAGVITIRADYEETEEEKKKKKVIYKEARRTHYVYTTNIPFPVKTDSAVAKIEHGVLVVTLPKAEEAKPKKIKIAASK